MNTEEGMHNILLQTERRERNRLLDPRCRCEVAGGRTRQEALLENRLGEPIEVIRSATCPLKHDKVKSLALLHLVEVNGLWPYEKEDPVVMYIDGTPGTISTAQMK